MAEYAPTLVAISDVGHAQPRRVAEFGSNSAGGVTLTVIDPDGCLDACAETVARADDGAGGPAPGRPRVAG